MKDSSISEWSRSKSKGSKQGEAGKNSLSDIKPKMESKIVVKTEKSTENSLESSNFKELFVNQDIKLSALDSGAVQKSPFQLPFLDHSLLKPALSPKLKKQTNFEKIRDFGQSMEIKRIVDKISINVNKKQVLLESTKKTRKTEIIMKTETSKNEGKNEILIIQGNYNGDLNEVIDSKDESFHN